MKLSEQIKQCFNVVGCGECENYETRSMLTCPGLMKKAYERIKEYEDLEEQGKLLKLPCAIGDLLYEPQINTGMVEEYIVIHICYTCECEIFLGSKLNFEIYSKIKGIYIGEIGKTVFHTKEEAETALQKMKEREC